MSRTKTTYRGSPSARCTTGSRMAWCAMLWVSTILGMPG